MDAAESCEDLDAHETISRPRDSELFPRCPAVMHENLSTEYDRRPVHR